ncbi:hypothetical protein GCK72_011797 [Caenorhabditis remanei]|uniref:C-type lectin domain-containing protein n=1 Tax=Caenorhabditis remanei TaxID=31234 RepID=A0A6A5H9M8_CAERE|nr:hypothetical protein GCK72_011797 [Caenorhabditis remanei]KAF1763531.1 hypothetical protein GCK72_011797 [Caenorhabditis remanei]
MVSYRLLSVLFILTIGLIGVTGGENLSLASLISISENQEEIPCEDESTPSNNNGKETTVTTTTTVPKTTTIRPCGKMFVYGANSTNIYEYDNAFFDCNLNNLVLGSLETDKEKAAYIKLVEETVLYDLTALWVAASLNTTDQKYYWDDGHAVGLLDPQPTVVDPNGRVA